MLITGESGTGKELAARSLHAGSSRAGRPFVAVNCAAIPANLVESELFGHAKGAFTGASSARTGRFAQADGGTILLDEIGEMEIGVQAKLLRLIQDGELYPVGEETATRIDVRILAATNRNLEREVAAGRFRADLYWRLAVIPVELPSLRERRSDILRLAEHFLRRANERHRRGVAGFDPQALAALEAYPWPGNIRELENVIERLVIVKGHGTIGFSDLPRGGAHAAQPDTERDHAAAGVARGRHRPARDAGGGRGPHDRRGARAHRGQQEPRRRAARASTAPRWSRSSAASASPRRGRLDSARWRVRADYGRSSPKLAMNWVLTEVVILCRSPC